jgi:hypothetical protein
MMLQLLMMTMHEGFGHKAKQLPCPALLGVAIAVGVT